MVQKIVIIVQKMVKICYNKKKWYYICIIIIYSTYELITYIGTKSLGT
jgi:hypothetical protein